MASRILGTTGLILALALLFAVNIYSNATLSGQRIDLTENKLYTLSAGTYAILGKLEEPVTLRFYLSQKVVTRLPGLGSYASRVKELLAEFERAANGKIKVLVIDPEPFSEEEDRAVGYGVRGVPLNEGDEILYFGVAGTSSIDDEKVIPYVSIEREQFLEYDLAKLVHNLANPKRKVIGLLSSLPIGGMGPRAQLQGLTAPPWVVYDQITQLFEVKTIEARDGEIPDTVDVVMVVHPRELSEKLQYAVDQFVLGGGNAPRVRRPQFGQPAGHHDGRVQHEPGPRFVFRAAAEGLGGGAGAQQSRRGSGPCGDGSNGATGADDRVRVSGVAQCAARVF